MTGRTGEKAPVWCSVDLRDGNQALVIPMQKEAKLRLFKTLLEIGFKEIEVGFPSASDTEYEIIRTLIENNMVPDDVTLQVLVQARPELIRKTFEAVKGARNVIAAAKNRVSERYGWHRGHCRPGRKIDPPSDGRRSRP